MCPKNMKTDQPIWPDQLTTLGWFKMVFQQSCAAFTITHFIEHTICQMFGYA